MNQRTPTVGTTIGQNIAPSMLAHLCRSPLSIRLAYVASAPVTIPPQMYSHMIMYCSTFWPFLSRFVVSANSITDVLPAIRFDVASRDTVANAAEQHF